MCSSDLYYGRRSLGDNDQASFRVSHDATLIVYKLYNSIILDSGLTCYVRNNCTRFILFVLAKEDKVLYASETVILILG